MLFYTIRKKTMFDFCRSIPATSLAGGRNWAGRMDNTTYVTLSLATALTRDMDVTANNVANASTIGFKGERVVFETYLQTNAATGEETSLVLDKGSYLDDRQGSVTHTGNPLDVALQGPGWLGYLTPNGQVTFGRDGRFGLDAQSNLVTLSGAKVLDASGSPIALPPDIADGVHISEDGTISAQGVGTIAVLGVFEQPDIQSFERIGNGMFVPPEGVEPDLIPDTATTVTQRAVEGSNIQPVTEITRMMDIQKAYDRTLKLISGDDDLLRDTLRRLGSVS